jgi:hypothetical protein
MGGRVNEPASQFRVLISEQTRAALETQATHIGLDSPNQLAAMMVTALADLPPERVFAGLALIHDFAAKTRREKGQRR